MFQDIYINNIDNVWILEDSEFVERSYGFNAAYAICVIYAKKNLPVPQNLKLYYNQFHSKYRLSKLQEDMNKFDLYSTGQEYKKLYYNCLLNHIIKLQWIGK